MESNLLSGRLMIYVKGIEMGLMEIVLIVIGLAAFVLGFLLPADRRGGTQSSVQIDEEDIRNVVEKEIEDAKSQISDIVDETITYAMEKTERSMDRLTNEKMLAVNEYSDTVIEKMNKTHNEIMFLYSMLNDKHTELTDFTSSLTQQLSDLKRQEEEMTNGFIEQLKNQIGQQAQIQKTAAAEPSAPKPASATAPAKEPSGSNLPVPASPVQKEGAKDDDTAKEAASADASKPQEEEKEVNVKDEIIRLYEQGRDSVAIAKNLGLGVGEVRLILGLYKGD